MKEQSKTCWRKEQCAFLLNFPGSQTLRCNCLIHKLNFLLYESKNRLQEGLIQSV